MDNILYLDDYINLYSKRLNQIIKWQPYKNTLKEGRIINREKFLKNFNMLLKKYNLNNNLFTSYITVIVNNNYTLEDKRLLELCLDELNFRHYKITKETNYLNINKDAVYISFNSTYFILYYQDFYGDITTKLFTYNDITKNLIPSIIKIVNKNNIYIYGKNYLELKNILDKLKVNYYYYLDSENLMLKLFLEKNMSNKLI